MTRLGEVIESLVDCEHKTAPLDERGEFYAVGTPAMQGNRINLGEARRISHDTFRQWTRRLSPRQGDILLAREAPVGPVVVIPVEENVAPGQRTVLMRPARGAVSPRFLFYALAAPATQGLLQVKAAGSTVAHLNVADIREFVFPWPFPRLGSQHAIADVLGALDDKIAANRRVAGLAEELLSTLFRKLQAAEDAQLRPVTDFLEFNPAYRAARGVEATFVDMQKLSTGSSMIDDWSHRAAASGSRFRNGDTLFARITPCLENGKVGFVDFLGPEETGTGSTEFIVMRAKDSVPLPVSFFIATDEGFRSHAMQHMAGTSGRQRVAARDLENFEIPLGQPTSLAGFGHLATPSFELLGRLRDENRYLAHLRDTLLPPLMSGRLTVRQAETVVESAL